MIILRILLRRRFLGRTHFLGRPGNLYTLGSPAREYYQKIIHF